MLRPNIFSGKALVKLILSETEVIWDLDALYSYKHIYPQLDHFIQLCKLPRLTMLRHLGPNTRVRISGCMYKNESIADGVTSDASHDLFEEHELMHANRWFRVL